MSSEALLTTEYSDLGPSYGEACRRADESKSNNFAQTVARTPERPASRFKPLALAEFFKLAIKPRGMVLAPIIPEKGLAMVYASRGTGKTYLALGIAYAVATGT